ncbi:putative leader peptide [Streptomyces sp. NPDC059459]|uniref:putative leader peptide n=1 Tax=Streptomyces sp. NPDC059459 TaxID=3346839 RepID=UPI0036B0CFB5
MPSAVVLAPVVLSALASAARCRCPLREVPASVGPFVGHCPYGDGELTGRIHHGLLRIVTDTFVRLWRRVHMDLVRYAGCVCRPSC